MALDLARPSRCQFTLVLLHSTSSVAKRTLSPVIRTELRSRFLLSGARYSLTSPEAVNRSRRVLLPFGQSTRRPRHLSGQPNGYQTLTRGSSLGWICTSGRYGSKASFYARRWCTDQIYRMLCQEDVGRHIHIFSAAVVDERTSTPFFSSSTYTGPFVHNLTTRRRYGHDYSSFFSSRLPRALHAYFWRLLYGMHGAWRHRVCLGLLRILLHSSTV